MPNLCTPQPHNPATAVTTPGTPVKKVRQVHALSAGALTTTRNECDLLRLNNKFMPRKNVTKFNDEMAKAKNAVNLAESLDYENKNIRMYLENAIAYLQNAKRLTNK